VFKQRAWPDTHGDIEFEMDGARLKFLWDPWLNGSALHEELRAFRQRHGRRSQEANEMEIRRSVVMLIGGGLSHARHYETDAVVHFQHSVDSIISTAYGDSSPADMRSAPTTSPEGVGDEIFFAPVIEPIYGMLSPAREVTITPDKINAMNRYLAEQSSQKKLNVLWSYTNMTKCHSERYQESGLHVVESVANNMADVLLNLRCNGKAARRGGFPHNRTCCSAYQPMSIFQVAGSTLTVVLFVSMVVGNAKVQLARSVFSRPSLPWSGYKARTAHLECYHGTFSRSAAVCTRQTQHRSYPHLKSYRGKLPAAVFTLSLAVCYCLVTDRTQIFEKEQKVFSKLDFGIILGVVFVLCLLNIKAASPSQHEGNRADMSANPTLTSFLPRVQSDEFKGWVQVFLLVYNYMGAEQVVELYELHRIAIASYLFFFGYGHAMYFLQSGDVSLLRVTTVLFRTNALAILLSFIMDRPYTSYHFAPLVSFWTLVVCFTLKPTSRSHGSLRHMCGRVAVSALFTTSLVYVRCILDWSFLVLGYTFRADLDAEAWRNYLGTDTYIVYIGFLVAILHLRVGSIRRRRLARLNGVPRFFRRYFRAFQAFTVGLALIILPGFWTLTRRSPNKADYDWWMPYIAWLPVLSVVILRNSTHFLRSHYCVPFAWLGRMSLELYLLSQHMWSAGDGYGRLRAGFGGGSSLLRGAWWDLVIMTPILLGSAWSVKTATAVITAWFMGADVEADTERAAYKGHGGEGDGVVTTDLSGGRLVMVRRGGIPKGGLPSAVKKRLVLILVVVWMGSLLGRGHVGSVTW
jgi:hypothetical protein